MSFIAINLKFYQIIKNNTSYKESIFRAKCAVYKISKLQRSKFFNQKIFFSLLTFYLLYWYCYQYLYVNNNEFFINSLKIIVTL